MSTRYDAVLTNITRNHDINVIGDAVSKQCRGVIISLMCDDLGKLSKLHQIIVSQNCAITCLHGSAGKLETLRYWLIVLQMQFIYLISNIDGRLNIKKKYNVRHKSGRCLVRSTFCSIMSFRKGACIVSGSEHSCVYFIDIVRDSNFMVNKLQGHSCLVLVVCFNYDESLLATSDQQGMVIIWSREKKTAKEFF
ncbi:hypothetical protein PGB90_005965 [Kerria lacca]